MLAKIYVNNELYGSYEVHSHKPNEIIADTRTRHAFMNEFSDYLISEKLIDYNGQKNSAVKIIFSKAVRVE